jgi:hypothetical protein
MLQASNIKIGHSYWINCHSASASLGKIRMRVTKCRILPPGDPELGPAWNNLCDGCTGRSKTCWSFLCEIVEEINTVNTLGNFPKKEEEVSADGCI